MGEPDAVPGNNHYLTYLVPERPPRVLIVDPEPGRARPLARALGNGFEVSIRGSGGIPRSLEEWRKFDTVIVSDLPRVRDYSRNLFNPRQMADADRFEPDQHFARAGLGNRDIFNG